jgi:hypothetical protein
MPSHQSRHNNFPTLELDYDILKPVLINPLNCNPAPSDESREMPEITSKLR